MQRLILDCSCTRHHDGFVRQRHLEAIVGSAEPWVAPFVVRLLGEYAVEIVEVIARELDGLPDDSPLVDPYRAFARGNRPMVERTLSQAATYWGLYHRHRYAMFASYPARGLLVRLRVLSA